MARVKTSSLLAEIRGNLGGVVFSSNGNGFYCRQQRIPVQPRTQAQTVRRSRFADCAHSFSSLSPVTVADWVTFAADPSNTRYNYFGDAYLPNAFNQFASINLMRMSAGLAVTYTAPTDALPASLPAMSVFLDFQPAGSNSYLSRLAAFDPSIAYVHVLIRLWASFGRSQPPRPLYFLALYPAGSFPSVDIQADLVNRFGSLPSDGNWFLVLSSVSSEFRIGPGRSFAGRSGDTVNG